MPKPISLKWLLSWLAIHGFLFIRQKGSHAKYRSTGKPARTVIVPLHGKEVPHGTFRSIVRQAGLQEEVDQIF